MKSLCLVVLALAAAAPCVLAQEEAEPAAAGAAVEPPPQVKQFVTLLDDPVMTKQSASFGSGNATSINRTSCNTHS